MTKASKQAFTDTENQKKRISIKKRIKLVYDSTNGSYSAREMALILKFPDHLTSRRRMLELESTGYLIITGTRLENGQPNSVYSINRSPEIFPSKKKSKIDLLKQAIRSYALNEEAIFMEYDRLINYKNK